MAKHQVFGFYDSQCMLVVVEEMYKFIYKICTSDARTMRSCQQRTANPGSIQ